MDIEVRKCWDCGIEKRSDLFYPNKTKKDNRCRACYSKSRKNKYKDPKIREKLLKKAGAYHKTVKGKLVSKRALLMYRFKLDLLDYYKLVEKQNNKCSICNKEETILYKGKPKQLCIDHCHKTGKIRGLLCCSCNIGLGKFKDSTRVLNDAIKYLEEN